jgi:hypothetical protein
MKARRIVLHRRRGLTKINDRDMFRIFSAFNSLILNGREGLTHLEARILTEEGVNL